MGDLLILKYLFKQGGNTFFEKRSLKHLLFVPDIFIRNYFKNYINKGGQSTSPTIKNTPSHIKNTKIRVRNMYQLGERIQTKLLNDPLKSSPTRFQRRIERIGRHVEKNLQYYIFVFHYVYVLCKYISVFPSILKNFFLD